jgi:ribosomal protein L40E
VDALWFVLIVALVGALGVLAGGGREDVRQRRRWDSAFHAETHKLTHTDATGVLMCRRCGASGSERAGRCPACGAVL